MSHKYVIEKKWVNKDNSSDDSLSGYKVSLQDMLAWKGEEKHHIRRNRVKIMLYMKTLRRSERSTANRI